MEKEKQIEEIAVTIANFRGQICKSGNCKTCINRIDKNAECCFIKQAKLLYNAGYRKEIQGECEYCKTGDEKCGTCAYFIGIDTNDALDRCSEYYGENKCVKYKPASHCFNCGAKMKGAE